MYGYSLVTDIWRSSYYSLLNNISFEVPGTIALLVYRVCSLAVLLKKVDPAACHTFHTQLALNN